MRSKEQFIKAPQEVNHKKLVETTEKDETI